MLLHCRPRQSSRPEVAHSGILLDGKVRHSHAQINGGGGKRSVFSVSSGYGWGPNPVVVDGGWQVREPLPYWAPVRVLGGVLLVAGLIALVGAFVRFVVEGFGTPAPVAAPEHLVVGGVYRYVRNPMYVAVLAAIVGQSLLLGRLGLLLYAGVTWVAVAAFVRLYEEPTLTRRFGADYEAYRRAVPAWWPRLRPWEPGEREGPGAG
jgi:protein-S-isoprenylcysteine O-methyltransferase Ste14